MKAQASTTLTRMMLMRRTLTRGGHALRLGAGLLLVFLPLVPLSARVHHNDAWARQQFAKAERMREALNGRPRTQRTRREYQRVIDSYRQVYLGSPASSKADPSVVASAELMVEMGRRFNDNKILHGAIEQYYFLRNQYPGSRYRFDALFTIGEIYKDDLNDPENARRTFEDFLHRYPRNRLADDARAAVKALDVQADAKEHSTRKAARKQAASGSAGNQAGNAIAGNNGKAGNGAGSHDIAKPDEAADSADASGAADSGLPRVTGVRHWSTPDYTRVAIDVEQEVKFASQRISHPDRIFFDLRDTRLASTLVGKTFDVDDGFLKKIRVAEFQPGRTRIVLEVDDLASYDAFLLPDPYRLIIDIHGKDIHGKDIHGKDNLGKDNLGKQARAATDAVDTVGGAPESEDASGAATASSKVAVSSVATPGGRKTRRGSGLIETDLPPPDDDSANSTASSDSPRPVKGLGVVKTTTAIKGSERRIPKTIVEADDRAPTTMATLEPEKIEPEATVDAGVTPNDETKPAKLGASHSSSSSLSSKHSSTTSSSSSSVSVRPKKSHSSAKTADTHDIDKSDTDNEGLDPRDGRDAARRDNDNPGVETRTLESREARPTASGDRSLTRALGLKIGKIVIDAGHGGHDTGTIGPNGLEEKDLVLDVSKRLGRLLESRLGAEVVYTRRDDTFVPLETRTAIANRERADLFISIHANSSRDADARGVETYYLNFTSSPEALEVAARENAVSEKSIHELQDLVKKIAMKEKIDESREFAGDVQESLYGGLGLQNAGIRDRGIKKAPFIVLIGANMPSILAEISFVSNPTDERKCETPEHRQRIAESLYRGVSKYVNGLSGVKVASKIDKGEGQ